MDYSQDQDATAQRHPTSQQWENLKLVMYDLYIEQGLPLTVVQEKMAGCGHVASCRMYKSRFDGWDWGKNTLHQDWQAFAILRDRAKTAGIELRQVQIHRRIRNLAELSRYLRSQKTSEADFLNDALKAGISVPDHIQSIPTSVSKMYPIAATEGVSSPTENVNNSWTDDALTPMNDTQGLAMDLSHSAIGPAQQPFREGSHATEDTGILSYQSQANSHDSESKVSFWFQSDSDGMSHDLFAYLAQAVSPMSGIMPPGPSFADLSESAGRYNLRHSPQAFDSIHMTGDTNTISRFFSPMNQRSAEIRQNSEEVGRLDNAGEESHLRDAVPLALRLPTPIPGSVPDPMLKYVQTKEHHDFMGAVFMACMSDAAKTPGRGRTQELDLAETWMGQATLKLKEMCTAHDPMLLVTVHMILVWLQVHDTEFRAKALLRRLSQAAAGEIGEHNPIAVILECMTDAAGKGLANSLIGLDTLRDVVHYFEAQWGPEHPHTLVASYYVCFHMMRVERKFAEAEEELTKLYQTTSRILGGSSFQAVNVLATLSRAEVRQGKHRAALDTMDRCLREAPLGLNHPHRLELLKRKALICWSLKDKLKPEEQAERLYWDEKIEGLYWIVCKGRVATLGRYHKDTEEAQDTLVKILVANGKYGTGTVKGQVHELLTKPQVAVSHYECWWWTMVPQARKREEQQAPRERTREPW